MRRIAGNCGLPVSTVGGELRRAQAAGLSWPLPEGISDAELAERLLKPVEPSGSAPPAKPLLDWRVVHEQLSRKRVSPQLLWEEYRQAHPEGYQRSQFCQLYRDWAQTIEPVMRQIRLPGEHLFVDWAGQKVAIQASDAGLEIFHLHRVQISRTYLGRLREASTLDGRRKLTK